MTSTCLLPVQVDILTETTTTSVAPAPLALCVNNTKRGLGLSLSGRRTTSKRRLCEISSSNHDINEANEASESRRRNNPPAKKTVQFASEDEDKMVEVVFYEHPAFNSTDVWYTPQDYKQMEQDNLTVYQSHVTSSSNGMVTGNSDKVTFLQKLYDQCLKTAVVVKRPQIRRGLSGDKKKPAHSNNTASDLDNTMDLEILLGEVRGLETAFLPSLKQKRSLATKQVLMAQRNMSKAHPTMRQRSITNTAQHVSRMPTIWAQTLAKFDAKEA